jgi:type VI secretion system protein ImpL
MLPVLFTKDGYDDVDLTPESPVIAAILKDNWVLGDKAHVDFRKEDLKGISKEVNEYYLKEYATRWRHALDSIKVAEFTSLQQGVDMLSVFADPVYSPIVNILNTTSTHTGLHLQAMLEVPGSDSDNSLLKSSASLVSGKLEGNRVDKTFRDLNKLTFQSSKRPPPVEKILASVDEVRNYLNEISISASPEKAAYTAAKTRFQSNGADAIQKMRAIAAKAPKPVDDWLYTIADQSWRVTINAGKGHINNEWRNLVANQYRHALAGRFPMKTTAEQELTLTDFSDFFKSGGTLDAFVQEYISPFVDVRRNWRVKHVNKRSMYFSKDAIRELKRAETIRRIFFRADPEAPSIQFQMRPVYMDKSVTRFELDMGGQRIIYSHGPKFWQDVSWPGKEETDFVRMRFVEIDDNDVTKDYDGPWGWFRMLQDANIRKTNAANIYDVTFTSNSKVARFQIKANSVTNPFDTNILSQFDFPQHL